MSVLSGVKIVCHSDVYLEEFFENADFEISPDNETPRKVTQHEAKRQDLINRQVGLCISQVRKQQDLFIPPDGSVYFASQMKQTAVNNNIHHHPNYNDNKCLEMDFKLVVSNSSLFFKDNFAKIPTILYCTKLS